jgi:hypothetical protein
MVEMTALARLTEIDKQLAKIKTVDGFRDVRDKAAALTAYFKTAHVGLGMQNQAAYIKVQAERKCGALLAEMKKAKGGRGKTASGPEAVIKQIGHTQAARWQTMARVPEAVLQQARAQADEGNYEFTSALVYRLGRSGSTHHTRPRHKNGRRSRRHIEPVAFATNAVTKARDYLRTARLRLDGLTKLDAEGVAWVREQIELALGALADAEPTGNGNHLG